MFLNSAALHRFAITRDTPIPAGGQISRDARQQLTGALIDTARDLVKLPPAPALSEADLIRTQEILNSYGITAVSIPGIYKRSEEHTHELQSLKRISYAVLSLK